VSVANYLRAWPFLTVFSLANDRSVFRTIPSCPDAGSSPAHVIHRYLSACPLSPYFARPLPDLFCCRFPAPAQPISFTSYLIARLASLATLTLFRSPMT
jgi:hypothetical protein